MFQTPYQESQLVYLSSKFIHVINYIILLEEGKGYAKYYGQLQGGGGGLEMAKKRLRN